MTDIDLQAIKKRHGFECIALVNGEDIAYIREHPLYSGYEAGLVYRRYQSQFLRNEFDVTANTISSVKRKVTINFCQKVKWE